MAVFLTRIRAMGPEGNVFAVLGNATGLMRRIMQETGEGGLVTKNDVEALRRKVLAAHSYREAIDAIREWFPVDTDDGGDDE